MLLVKGKGTIFYSIQVTIQTQYRCVLLHNVLMILKGKTVAWSAIFFPILITKGLLQSKFYDGKFKTCLACKAVTNSLSYRATIIIMTTTYCMTYDL